MIDWYRIVPRIVPWLFKLVGYVLNDNIHLKLFFSCPARWVIFVFKLISYVDVGLIKRGDMFQGLLGGPLESSQGKQFRTTICGDRWGGHKSSQEVALPHGKSPMQGNDVVWFVNLCSNIIFWLGSFSFFPWSDLLNHWTIFSLQGLWIMHTMKSVCAACLSESSLSVGTCILTIMFVSTEKLHRGTLWLSEGWEYEKCWLCEAERCLWKEMQGLIYTFSCWQVF